MQDENAQGLPKRYEREAYLRRMKCEVVLAILDGCCRTEVVARLTTHNEVDLTEANYLIGVFHISFPTSAHHFDDKITPERRQELVELSTAD